MAKILKIQLNNSAIDQEVYSLLKDYDEVSLKNFIWSAVLYYSRSPLVMMGREVEDLSDKLDSIFDKLEGLERLPSVSRKPQVVSELVQGDSLPLAGLGVIDKAALAGLRKSFAL
jgi:hypothetical protein